jgi:hypothetical protein
VTTRRRVKVPGTVLERAREVVASAPPKKPAPPPVVSRAKLLPREKVIAALKKLKSHPMD